MAEFDSEDSLDGALIIDDEPLNDLKTTEIKEEIDSDVEIIEVDDNVNDRFHSIVSPSSSTNVGTTCKLCCRRFLTNNELLNHSRKFYGKNCTITTNVQLSTKRPKTYDLTPEHSVIKKRYRPIKCRPLPVPDAIPIVPQLLPVNSTPPSPPTINVMPPLPPVSPTIDVPPPMPPSLHTNNVMLPLPSLSQELINEIEPEYPCTQCSQIFRHNIGLICHMDSEHSTESPQENVREKSSTKMQKNKQKNKKIPEKHSEKHEDNKQIENYEPISNIIDLSLVSDLKKDSLLNRMKSYVYQNANKDKTICILCNLDFKTIKKTLAHVEDKHITEKIECGYCNMKFVYELKLRSHMAKRHKVISVNKCDKCSKMINKDESELHLKKCVDKTQIKSEKNENSNS